MKVIVQNGANHSLSRVVVERALAGVPHEWVKNVTQLIISAETSDFPVATFHENDCSISINGPRDTAALPAVLVELLSSLSVIAERGELPSRLGAQVRAEHVAAANAVLAKAALHP